MARVLSDPSVTVIVVEQRNRFAQFGSDHLEAAHGYRILVVDTGEAVGDLVGGIVDLLTSICTPLYGSGGAGDCELHAATLTKQPESAEAAG